MIMIRRTMTALLCFLMGLCAFIGPVEAKWFGKNEKARKEAEAVENVRTFQPPPENAMALYCEPYRREAVKLSQKPRLLKVFYEPRRAWNIRQHQKCTQRLMDQEYLYLKHVDIQQPPSLPKLNTGATTPAKPVKEGGTVAPKEPEGAKHDQPE